MRFHLRSPKDDGVDRPDLDAPQGVKATGTNRPKQTHTPKKRVCQQQTQQDNHTVVFASTTQYLTQHQQPDVALCVCRWPIAAGKRPVPIPNPEAKPANADGTATGRLWESKKPPTPNNKQQLNTTSPPPLSNHSTVTGFVVVFAHSLQAQTRNTDLRAAHPRLRLWTAMDPCTVHTRYLSQMKRPGSLTSIEAFWV